MLPPTGAPTQDDDGDGDDGDGDDGDGDGDDGDGGERNILVSPLSLPTHPVYWIPLFF